MLGPNSALDSLRPRFAPIWAIATRASFGSFEAPWVPGMPAAQASQGTDRHRTWNIGGDEAVISIGGNQQTALSLEDSPAFHIRMHLDGIEMSCDVLVLGDHEIVLPTFENHPFQVVFIMPVYERFGFGHEFTSVKEYVGMPIYSYTYMN